jgi:hypothetical protein
MPDLLLQAPKFKSIELGIQRCKFFNSISTESYDKINCRNCWLEKYQTNLYDARIELSAEPLTIEEFEEDSIPLSASSSKLMNKLHLLIYSKMVVLHQVLLSSFLTQFLASKLQKHLRSYQEVFIINDGYSPNIE